MSEPTGDDVTGFVELAPAAFAFLRPLGFALTINTSLECQFESKRVHVRLFNDQRRDGLSVSFGRRRGSPWESYDIDSLIALRAPEVASPFTVQFLRNREAMRRMLEACAAHLEALGQDALRGEALVYEQLEADRRRRYDAYAAKDAYRRAIPHADEAFRAKDYATAARLLGEVEAMLSPAERKKLEIARARAATQEPLFPDLPRRTGFWASLKNAWDILGGKRR